MTLTPDQFAAFFEELHGVTPFPWQRRLAAQVSEGTWPEFIDLPTASGKTACIDVAIFALAVQAALRPEERTVSRRIFFVVNRRVIVDEAYERASRIRKELINAEPGTVLHDVAQTLRRISGDEDAPPLDVSLLRGGVVRDNRWARSITQPTVITSTIDQVGSRLLFRGYGLRDEAAPLHAALIAHDSTILLDEAHISRPFVETLQAIRKYRGDEWAEQPIRTPFHFVQMTATHDAASGNVLQLDEEDRADEVLRKRHDSSKPIRLEVAKKAKGKKTLSELAAAVVEEAVNLQSDARQNIAIVVNRVATAREAYDLLRERFAANDDQEPAADVELAIGRMRPYDRDQLTQRIQERVGNRTSNSSDDVNDDDSETRPFFVVATQCLEVGADFDFDGMVSECASLDALRQRFGRLNRSGNHKQPAGAIIIRADQVRTEAQLAALEKKGDVDDPIYGNALARTWNWLQEVAADGHVDFGVNAMGRQIAHH
ncbi:MAG: type I-U CRISPR-associated helicase/endonuclease Cas3, partial [Maioricimonas sp. JB049]